jgi:hypothetical protein
MNAKFRATSISLSVVLFIGALSGCGSASNSPTAANPPAPVSVAIAGPQTALLGTSAQYTATVTGSSNQAVTWGVDQLVGGNAQVGTISTSGLYSAPATLPSSLTVTITAFSQASTTASQSLQVGLQALGPISGPQAVVLGTSAQYTAAVYGTSQSLSWSVNQVTGGNAQVGTISTNGLYSAPVALPSTSSIAISASSQTNSADSQTLQATLQITPSGPASIPTVVSANAMGTIVQNAHVNGRDGTYSALINGVSKWYFDDTSMNIYNAEGENFISNSLSWTTNLNASSGIDLNQDYIDSTGVLTEFVPFTSDEAAFNAAHGQKSSCSITTDPLCGESYAIWPSPVFAVPNSTTGEAYHFYLLIQRGGAIPAGTWNTVGVGIAYEQNGVTTRPIITPGAANPTLMWQGTTNAYYNGGVVQNGILYMAGCAQIVVIQHECTIARVPLANILTLSDWTYYNATTGQWVSDPTQASVLFNGGASGNTLFFNPALNEYMTIYMASPVTNNEVVFRVAPAPWGPWSVAQNLFATVPPIGTSSAMDYAAQPHTEFQEQNGLVQYVTYVQDNSNLGFAGQDIQLVRVTFAP